MALPLVDWTGWPAAAIDGFAPRWHALARGDFALRGTARAMTAPERRGGLTAKFAIGGREWYRTDGQATCADEDGWLVLAEGERYASRIAADRPVTTLALFFAPATIAAARAARGSDVALLDDPLARASDEPVGGGCRRLAFDPELARAVADADDVAGVCELHALALDRILEAAARAAGERARIAAVRPSTRAELHRRLCRAHDLLMTAYAEPLSLDDLARAATMAPHHFLRRFRAAFGVTPHRALIARRIAVAERLLRTTDAPIGEIAVAVGFASLAAFSARFRRETGRSPRVTRALSTRYASFHETA